MPQATNYQKQMCDKIIDLLKYGIVVIMHTIKMSRSYEGGISDNSYIEEHFFPKFSVTTKLEAKMRIRLNQLFTLYYQ